MYVRAYILWTVGGWLFSSMSVRSSLLGRRASRDCGGSIEVWWSRKKISTTASPSLNDTDINYGITTGSCKHRAVDDTWFEPFAPSVSSLSFSLSLLLFTRPDSRWINLCLSLFLSLTIWFSFLFRWHGTSKRSVVRSGNFISVKTLKSERSSWKT